MAAQLSPIWHAEPGTWDEYQVISIDGQYDPATLELGVTAFHWNLAYTTRITNFATPGIYPLPGVVRVFGPEGVDVSALPDGLSNKFPYAQTEGRWEIGPLPPFAGEINGGPGTAQYPPEIIVTDTPVVGEDFQYDCTAFGFGTNPLLPHSTKEPAYIDVMRLRYRTLAKGVVWDRWTNCVKTALVERWGSATPSIYNYVFSGGRKVNDWFLLNADPKTCKGSGFMYYLLRSNP